MLRTAGAAHARAAGEPRGASRHVRRLRGAGARLRARHRARQARARDRHRDVRRRAADQLGRMGPARVRRRLRVQRDRRVERARRGGRRAGRRDQPADRARRRRGGRGRRVAPPESAARDRRRRSRAWRARSPRPIRSCRGRSGSSPPASSISSCACRPAAASSPSTRPIRSPSRRCSSPPCSPPPIDSCGLFPRAVLWGVCAIAAALTLGIVVACARPRPVEMGRGQPHGRAALSRSDMRRPPGSW